MSAKENKTKQHFHFGHLSLIAGSVAVILLISWFKGGFSFEKKQVSISKNYSYEQAQLDAAKQTLSSSGLSQKEQETQLALLDPNFLEGSVLGSSTGTLNTIFSDEATPIPQEILNIMPVLTTTDNTKEGVLNYLQNFTETEYINDVASILVSLGSSSAEDYKEVPNKVDVLVKALLALEVPSDLANYHRLKLLYYAELRDLANVNLGLNKDLDLDIISQQIFSVSEALNLEKQKISSKYQISL